MIILIGKRMRAKAMVKGSITAGLLIILVLDRLMAPQPQCSS